MNLENVVIEKLVHGGQGLGTLPTGQKIFVWNALPGEIVNVRLTKKRRDYLEGVAEEILKAAPDRLEPRDEAYLSTSPWQILPFETENTAKQAILTEAMAREHVDYTAEIPMHTDGREWQYRSKMEYSFWGDDDGLHLALFNRGSHGKRIITGSSLAMPAIDQVANAVCKVLDQAGIRGSQLKTVMLRANQAGQVVAAIFVKDPEFPQLPALDGLAQGLEVVFSNPKSPASVRTKSLYSFGDGRLEDNIDGVAIGYNVHSFFQVNLPVFEQALQAIKTAAEGQAELVDLYAGVGTIGLAVGAQTLVEIDAENIAMAQANAKGKANVVHASSETALQHITNQTAVIVDPPRAGLHTNLVDHLLDVKPPVLIYLSCNPSTQARDLAALQTAYSIEKIEGYNFFPRTPHIESLAVLRRLS